MLPLSKNTSLWTGFFDRGGVRIRGRTNVCGKQQSLLHFQCVKSTGKALTWRDLAGGCISWGIPYIMKETLDCPGIFRKAYYS